MRFTAVTCRRELVAAAPQDLFDGGPNRWPPNTRLGAPCLRAVASQEMVARRRTIQGNCLSIARNQETVVRTTKLYPLIIYGTAITCFILLI